MISAVLDLLERPLKNDHLLHDRYQITYFIGKGSYGLAYQAIDHKSGKTVVVKQLRKRKNRSKRKWLDREAKILSSLKHPSIPALIDILEEESKYFLVMEFVDGKNVEELIFYDEVKYDERESFKILYEVLKVIQYLHERGLVHRDLRLPNILINGHEVYVIDLGLAVWMNEKEPIPLQSMPLEKRLYLDISFQSDFYALGHFVLFLLYSNYQITSKKEKSWEQELNISEKSKQIIRRLLKLNGSYETVDEIIMDVENHLECI